MSQYVKTAGGSGVGGESHREFWIKYGEGGYDAGMEDVGFATQLSVSN